MSRRVSTGILALAMGAVVVAGCSSDGGDANPRVQVRPLLAGCSLTGTVATDAPPVDRPIGFALVIDGAKRICPAGPGMAIDDVVTEFVTEFEREKGLLRAMLLESTHDQVIFDLGQNLTSMARDRFVGAFEPFMGDILGDDPERSVDLCFRILSAMMVRRITAAFEWEIDRAIEPFQDEMTAVFRAYLLPRD